MSFLSASLQLFFDELRQDLTRYFGRGLPEFDKKYAKKHGFVAANQKWFAEIGIDFEQSGADLAVVESVVLTRNTVQHPGSITSVTISLRGSQVTRGPFPFFIHELERHGVDPDNLEILEHFPMILSITKEKFLTAVDEVDKLCEYVEAGARNIGSRRRT